MIDPFQPLLRFVTLAISGLAYVVESGEGGSAPRSARSAPREDRRRHDRHSLAPTIVSSDFISDTETTPYVAHTRYQAVFKDQDGNKWVTLNSVTLDIAPPPHRLRGPYGCLCTNHDQRAGSRYGSAQNNLALWCADLYDYARPSAPFRPDLFTGLGPCNARMHRSEFTELDEEWIEKDEHDESAVRLLDEQVFRFERHDEIDEAVRQALRMRFDRDKPPVPAVAKDYLTLKLDYGNWVAHKQEFRGRAIERLVTEGYWKTFREHNSALWDDLLLAGYFEHPPVGVWVVDTLALVPKIEQLIAYGVPVYYRWRNAFDNDPYFAKLQPRFAHSSSGISSRLCPRTPPGLSPSRSVGREETSVRRDKRDKTVHFDDEEFWVAADEKMDAFGMEQRAASAARFLETPTSPTRGQRWFTGHRATTSDTTRACTATTSSLGLPKLL